MERDAPEASGAHQGGGMGMILLGIFGFVENRMEIALIQYGALLSAIYSAWAIGSFLAIKS